LHLLAVSWLAEMSTPLERPALIVCDVMYAPCRLPSAVAVAILKRRRGDNRRGPLSRWPGN
jgi:hypothetical protein